MKKILFAVLPALGHLNPTLPVAAELYKRGHAIAYATGEDVRPPIENEGFAFLPAGPPGMSALSETMKRALKTKGLVGNYLFLRGLMEHHRQAVDGLKEAVFTHRPDMIVTDTLTFAGGEIAELYGRPWAACSAVPGLIPSRDAPPYTHWGLPPSNRIAVKSLYALVRCGQNMFFRFFDRHFNQVRAMLGLPSISCGVINTTMSPFLLLVFSCEGFEYKRSDWPPQAHLIGPSPWGREIDGSSFDWIDQLPGDLPVIYVTLGTVQSYRSPEFFHKAIEAFRDQPCRVVMSVSKTISLDRFTHVPPNIRIEQFVPNRKILKRASAVVHHAGFGISQDAVYNGLPSVVLPVDQDLFENARRCTEAGVARKLHFASLTPQRLRRAVWDVLRDETIKRNIKQLQQTFLATNAGIAGADLLETLAETGRPVCRA